MPVADIGKVCVHEGAAAAFEQVWNGHDFWPCSDAVQETDLAAQVFRRRC